MVKLSGGVGVAASLSCPSNKMEKSEGRFFLNTCNQKNITRDDTAYYIWLCEIY